MDTEPRRPRVSVKFDPVGRVHTFFLPDIDFETSLDPGQPVVVSRGESTGYGIVVRSVPEVDERKVQAADAPGPVIRRATEEDTTTRLKQQHREVDAYRFCLMKIRECGLQMKLVQVEHLFDGSRLIFYFTSEGRIDFRDLVRGLAAEFRMRIEMRQIGARDEAKVLGGYGTCGRPLCCTTWLQSFEPISIKMAKRQNLALNPSRLSGLCGRLKCCLRYELPNAKGEQYAGSAHESGCGSRGSSGGCGAGCGGASGCRGCGGR